MGLSFASILLPVALVFNMPVNPVLGIYEQGLFCESLELVEFVIELA